MSIDSAAGSLGRPGMVMILPELTLEELAPLLLTIDGNPVLS